jgi:hypothetical protein
MPMMMVVGNLNKMLSGGNQTAYDHAESVVAGATSVAAAVEASGVYTGAPVAAAGAAAAVIGVVPDAAQIAESRAVFSALPHSVDQTILAALRSAFSRRVPIRVSWIETLGPIQVHVQESDNRDLILIHLACPSGAQFPKGTP